MHRRCAWALTLVYLLVSLPCLSEYGPTWDTASGDYAYGESIVDFLLRGGAGTPDLAHVADFERRTPAPEFFRGFHWFQLFPFASTICGASARLFFHELGWLDPFVAWHLPVLLFSAALLFGMVCWLGSRIGPFGGALAGAFLITSPRYFGHAFHNMKDVPETVLYTASIVAGFFAMTRGRLGHWIALGVLSAAALAQKMNALFVPVHLALFFLFGRLVSRSGGRRPVLPPVRLAVALAVFAVTYIAFSPMFWTDTVGRITEQFREVIRVGTGDTPEVGGALSFGGLEQVLFTTPLPLLACAVLGAFVPGMTREVRLFLLLGVMIPVARTMLPNMRNFDGVRHFLEFLPPLCALAGHGGAWLGRLLAGERRVGLAVLAAACLAPGAIRTGLAAPHSTASFNLLRGGTAGARAAGDLDATDYWAVSYWHGLAWLRDHAPERATIIVPIASHVAACAAPVRLRADQSVTDGPHEELHAPLFVMYVTRAPHYDAAVFHLESSSTPVHQIEVEGAPILRIHRVDDAGEVGRFAELWRGQRIAAELWWDFVARLKEEAPTFEPIAWTVLEAASEARRHDEVAAFLHQKLPGLARERIDRVVHAFDWLRSNFWKPRQAMRKGVR